MAAKSRPIPSPIQIYADQWAAWRTSTLAAAVELDVSPRSMRASEPPTRWHRAPARTRPRRGGCSMSWSR